jgi:hypothetical protein
LISCSRCCRLLHKMGWGYAYFSEWWSYCSSFLIQPHHYLLWCSTRHCHWSWFTLSKLDDEWFACQIGF